MAKYSEEAAQQSKLQEMLDQGQRHAVNLKMIMIMMLTMMMTMTRTVLVDAQRNIHAEEQHEEKACRPSDDASSTIISHTAFTELRNFPNTPNTY